ncbi:hypothetical protein [Nitratireductor thuwali]|uniref:hypothetical protein n=1 Tax=Nitratireductor thuwali TaxID=2267699 RepID=UPI0030CC495E
MGPITYRFGRAIVHCNQKKAGFIAGFFVETAENRDFWGFALISRLVSPLLLHILRSSPVESLSGRN